MIKIFKSFISALVQNAFVSVIIAIITVPVLVSWLTGTVDILLYWLTYKAPVWLVIILSLAGIIYVHINNRRSSKFVSPEPNRFLIEDSGFKWRVIDHRNGHTSVDQVPLCTVHESELVLTPGNQYMCRETISSNCESKILDPNDLTFYWNLAKSKADAIVHKYETRH